MNVLRWIDAARARLRTIVGRQRADADLDDELSFHLAMQARANVERGMTDAEAHRRARLALGGLPQTAEACREQRPLAALETTMQDVRYAIRLLRKNPGFAAAAVLTLALGIGANTTMFSVLNTYLFRSLPYPDSGRLVEVFRASKISDSWPFSAANFLSYRERNDVFVHIAAFLNTGYKVARPGAPVEGITGMTVTGDFFPTLAVQPALGRVFGADEDQPGRNAVAVLSDRYWRTRWAADPAIVGHRVDMDGERVEIIGVMPPSFEHPLLWGLVDVWRPMAWTPEQQTNRGSASYRAIARLKPGVTVSQAEQSMTALIVNVWKETGANRDEGARLAPLHLSMSDNTARGVMWFTFLLAGFVLLIACANLANLQLVRAMARTREHGIRTALGAARLRLVKQSLVESLVSSWCGGLLSLPVAIAGVRFVNARLFPDWPGQIALDMRVFAFALLCALITGIVFGAAPAWLTSHTDPHTSMRDGARGTTGTWQRTRNGLVAGQLAFSLLLLTGAALFVRGIERFATADPGWRVDGLLSGRLALTGPRYATPPQRFAFFRDVEQRLRALPGVQDVALSQSVTAGGFNSSGGVIVEGHDTGGPQPEMFLEQVSTRFFDTLGIRLLAGRMFDATDTADHPPVIIINETAAKRFWPGQDPIGKRIGRPGPTPAAGPVSLQVVGVVNDVRFPATLATPYSPLQGFRPLAQVPLPFFSITLRTRMQPDLLTDPMRRAIAELDSMLLVSNIRTERRIVERGLGSVSLLARLLAMFAGLGLLLSAIGVYGVTAYSVAQRTHELGVRLALGAQAHDVLRLVMAQGIRMIGLGLVAGAAGAYIVARLLASMLPTVPMRDPAAAAAVIVVLLGCALAASFVPARRATRVNPIVALRAE